MRSVLAISGTSIVTFAAICLACSIMQLLGVAYGVRSVVFLLGTLGLAIAYVCVLVIAVPQLSGFNRLWGTAGITVVFVLGWLLAVAAARLANAWFGISS
jgi:hypothetical protein